MTVLTRNSVKRRIERYLKTEGQGLRILKPICDKKLHGSAYILDLETEEIVKDNTTIGELLAEYDLLLDDEKFEENTK